METIQRFNGLADVYAAARPSYAAELLDFLYTAQGLSPDSVVADVGSGTGKFTQLLLDRGSTVFAVEPNDGMRAKAEEKLAGCGRFHSLSGTASDTTLPEQSVDFVTAAQAFHWFDAAAFRTECRRILKPGGAVFLLWNIRDMDSPVNQACERLFRARCPGFRGFSGGIRPEDPRISEFFSGRYAYRAFANPLHYPSKEAFVNRNLSSSYAPREGMEEYAPFREELDAIFEQYRSGEGIWIPNHSAVHFGTLD